MCIYIFLCDNIVPTFISLLFATNTIVGCFYSNKAIHHKKELDSCVQYPQTGTSLGSGIVLCNTRLANLMLHVVAMMTFEVKFLSLSDNNSDWMITTRDPSIMPE